VFQTLTYNAFLGIVVGITIALPVLMIATSNVIGGMFATLMIACITICVLGILPLAGWKLDVCHQISVLQYKTRNASDKADDQRKILGIRTRRGIILRRRMNL